MWNFLFRTTWKVNILSSWPDLEHDIHCSSTVYREEKLMQNTFFSGRLPVFRVGHKAGVHHRFKRGQVLGCKKRRKSSHMVTNPWSSFVSVSSSISKPRWLTTVFDIAVSHATVGLFAHFLKPSLKPSVLLFCSAPCCWLHTSAWLLGPALHVLSLWRWLVFTCTIASCWNNCWSPCLSVSLLGQLFISGNSSFFFFFNTLIQKVSVLTKVIQKSFISTAYKWDSSESKSELTERFKQLHQRKYLCRLRHISDKTF